MAEGCQGSATGLRDDLSEAGNAESLTLLAALQATAPVGIGFVDRDYRVRHLNETLAAINGAPLSEQVGRRVPDLVPALWPQIAPVYDQVLENGRAVLNQ